MSNSIRDNKAIVSQHKTIRKPKKSGATRIVIAVAFIAIFLLAALKNPSESEIKAEIKTMMTDKINEKLRQEVTNKDNSTGEQIGSVLAMLFAPTIIDKWIQINVSDYIFFSTFDTNVTVDEEIRTIASGVIVFGIIVPLKTDIKTEFIK